MPALLLAAVLVPGTLLAAPVLTFDESTGFSGTNQDQSVGWQFDVTAPITVSGLGWFDEGGDGLGVAHTVGIWNSAGTLLTSVLVPSGTAASLDGQFRTVATAPITLSAGAGYIVGGQNFANSGDSLASNVTFTMHPSVTFVDATFSDLGAGFVRPTLFSVAETGFFGPSFSVADVPEPASMLMLALGMAAMGGRAPRRRPR